jgi:serine/threonine-protein kinase HipA
MAKTLDVYLHRDLAGQLKQDDGGQISFAYAESWLANPHALPLSHSLPLRSEYYRGKQCRGYFAGVLPEESNREIIARNLGISARNDYAMLERIGGECAGAVTFVPAGEPLPELPQKDDQYRTLSSDELARLLRELPRRPLLAGEAGIRLSLAGAQDKIAVRVEGDTISLPLGNAPSTHILKPAVERFAGLVHNEAFCMQLATTVGLPTAKTEIRKAEDVEFLLVERYDRILAHDAEGTARLERVHQEDFCQALDIVPEMKYQKEGGPSLKQCFTLLRAVSSAPVIDLARLLDAVLFNYLIGNNDAHGKNFSLLYRPAQTGQFEVRLAPLYDAVSTYFYPELTREMAMRIGDAYRSERVTKADFEKLAADAGLSKPLVNRRIPELAEAILAKLEGILSGVPSVQTLAEQIRTRCKHVRELW